MPRRARRRAMSALTTVCARPPLRERATLRARARAARRYVGAALAAACQARKELPFDIGIDMLVLDRVQMLKKMLFCSYIDI